MSRNDALARGDQSSRFSRFAGARGIDNPLRFPLDLVVRDSSFAPYLFFRSGAFAHLPFAEIEAVPQDELQHLRRRAARIPGQFLKATLLCCR